MVDGRVKGGLKINPPPSTPVRRWAVLVGVARYKDPALELRYADRDIEEFWKLLQTPRCGEFIDAHVRKLVNDQATMAEILRALRSFLHSASEDDLVFIYFSGHGMRDPQRQVHYFLPYETDHRDIAGTALPMREILQSLEENVRARRIILMMDACHSGAIGVHKGITPADPVILERYLSEFQASMPGFAVFTSSEAGEQSREDDALRHGVFTHLVLEALRGKASPHKDKVTLGDLIEYVTRRSREFGLQHPSPDSRDFDRDFVVAVTGGSNAATRRELGRAVFEMALESKDRRRFASAARHLAAAHDLAQHEGGLPEALLLAGIAELGAGDGVRACEHLREAARAAPEGRPGCEDAGYYLGVAHALSGELGEARRVFDDFARARPTSRHAPLARALALAFARGPAPTSSPGGRLHALLIGVNESAGFTLSGAANDVRLLSQLVKTHPGTSEQTRVRLVNEEATRERILHELRRLVETSAEDQVLVAFSGMAVDGDAWLVPYDARRITRGPGNPRSFLEGTIGVGELDQALNAIPARRKLLLLDTRSHVEFVRRASLPSCMYSVLFAAGPGIGPAEMEFELDGERRHAGVLTYAFVQAITALGFEAPWQEILTGIVAAVRARAQHIPQFVGSSAGPFLAERSSVPQLVELLDTSLFGDRRARSPIELEAWYATAILQLAALGAVGFSELHLAFAQALAAARAPRAAARALHRAVEDLLGQQPAAGSPPSVEHGRRDVGEQHDTGEERHRAAVGDALASEIAWCRASIAVQERRFDHARAAFREFAATAYAHDAARWTVDFNFEVGGLSERRPRALVVGVDRYVGPEVRPLFDAVSDARSVYDALLTRCNFDANDIRFLANPTCEQVIHVLGALVSDADESPVLFYFAGNGSHDETGHPTILGADARTQNVFDIKLDRLQSGPAPLMIVLDCDVADAGPDARFAPLDVRRRGAMRDVEADDEPVRLVQRGRIVAKLGHRITRTVVTRLSEVDPATASWAELARDLVANDRAEVVDHAPGQPLFQDAIGIARAEALLHRARRERWAMARDQILGLLEDKHEKRDLLVDLGTMLALLRDSVGAVDALNRAVVESKGTHAEARYHLGRVLLAAGKDLGRAQSELEAAALAEPDDPAIQFHLGAAIRAFFEKESLAKARAAWKKYLDAGAPLGHREEVEAFVRAGREVR